MKRHSQEEFNAWLEAGRTGGMEEDQNPAFLFSGIPNELLIRIVEGEINPRMIAEFTLKARGYGRAKTWTKNTD